MKYTSTAALVACLALTGACATFEAKEPPARIEPPKEISVPVGKNWKVVEEAPALQNERNERPPFQTEQSLEPEGVRRPTPPPEKGRKIESAQ